jgi:hypothetical protein
MIQTRDLATRFEAYSHWRRRLSSAIVALRDWLVQHDLADPRAEHKLEHLQRELEHDKLIVAFIAEFSRGKSELINAIFFADHGRRLLPSSAGRTTMCPTELLWDASRPPSIRLLPIETQLRHSSIADFKERGDEWVTLALDLASPDQMSDVLKRVSQVKRVPPSLAAQYGLQDVADGAQRKDTDEEAMIEIPCWRHAIINFPHPLLQQGLVILDTPGLNAIGIEPELTLNQLPDAHAVLFILAADAGVTKTDLEVWKQHLAGVEAGAAVSRMVILNKIDGLWDDLKSELAVGAEIARQAQAAAEILGVPQEQVFPVSAQTALLAKVTGDAALLARSRLPQLEAALSNTLIPAKRDLVGGAVRAEVSALASNVRAVLEMRRDSVESQLGELSNLRGKNREVIAHMMGRVHEEKLLFERGLQRYTALRNVFTDQTTHLFDSIGLEALRTNAARTRLAIEGSVFSKGISDAMNDFFGVIRSDLSGASKQIVEIQELMNAMYARFAAERGLERFAPPAFSMVRYQKEIDRLERAYNTQLNTVWNMVTKAKFPLMRRFFETIASRVKHVYDIANRDVDAWLRAVMSPLETQVKEHHVQLRQRLDSIRRIHVASDELVVRLADLAHAQEIVTAQIRGLERALMDIDSVIAQPDALPLAANG